MCPAGCVSCGWAYQYPLHYGQVLRNEVVKAVFQRRHPLVLFFLVLSGFTITERE